ncbi:MAG: hypothetical protein A2X15_13880 [Bacteroidetes bacterium GWB2_32_14]|nr:MAG: hypothetical protein A2X10_15485 [Bacteroidetes bacterium GWA2_33_15]OFX62768.1 MAG: hypothetical protein A2X15_13880 [Bacteroidetes bacterium GWB2_32_14]OFX67493.1 MAG: hypothetical protein A2X14_08590 [Bacteroidetes bacterium GWD2_33_33]
MKIKLVSQSRFLIIAILGSILIPLVSIILNVKFDISVEFFFTFITIGFLLLYFVIKLSIYYTVFAEITDEYIWIGDKKLNWSEIKSYDYDESAVFGKLILRDNFGSCIKILGKLKGQDSINFLELVERVKNKIDGINIKYETPKIEQKNFYNSKIAKPVGYFLIIFTITLTVYAFLHKKPIDNLFILRLIGFYLLLTVIIFRIFKIK